MQAFSNPANRRDHLTASEAVVGRLSAQMGPSMPGLAQQLVHEFASFLALQHQGGAQLDVAILFDAEANLTVLDIGAGNAALRTRAARAPRFLPTIDVRRNCIEIYSEFVFTLRVKQS